MDTDWTLACEFAEEHPTEAAQLLEGLDTEAVVPFLNSLPQPVAAAVFQDLAAPVATRILEATPPERAAAVLARLSLERAAALLRQVEPPTTEAVLSALPEEPAVLLRVLMRYPEESAGGLMNPRVFTLPPEIRVDEALQRVRQHSRQAMYYLYVVDRDQRLRGVVNIRELMLADADARVQAVMRDDVVRIGATTSLPAVLAHPGWLEHHVLPVVDAGGLFVGALRHKTLRRLTSEDGGGPRRTGTAGAGAALGELFQIGLSGLARSAAGGPRRTEP